MQLPPLLKGPRHARTTSCVLPDLDGELDLTPDLVRALCDRHAGIGADGVLRVVRTENDPRARRRHGCRGRALHGLPQRRRLGREMCGNGIRVFLRYLQLAGLAGTEMRRWRPAAACAGCAANPTVTSTTEMGVPGGA